MEIVGCSYRHRLELNAQLWGGSLKGARGSPVMLPPGRARLATWPRPAYSIT
jgi:hypothetical protein